MKITTSHSSILLLVLAFLSISNQAKAQLDTNDFVTTWDTRNITDQIENDSTIHIYADTNYTFNYDVDWNNDGVFDSIGVTKSITHKFSLPGIYTIRIRGTFPSLKFGSDVKYTISYDVGLDKIISVDQWGNQVWKNFENTFMGCTKVNFTATDAPNLDSVSSLNNFLNSATSFNSNINHWDVSNVKNMAALFSRASNFNQPLNNWDVSNVINVNYMFSYTTFNQPINSWNVSSVTNMNRMFFRSSFNQTINNWDVSSVTDMNEMFYQASYNKALKNWNVSSVTTMKYMFYHSSFNQEINSWDVSSVINMNGMFYSTEFNQALSNWDVSSVTDMGGMFGYSKFNQNLGNWNLNSNVNLTGMLSYSGLSVINYDSTLISWQAKPTPTYTILGATHLQFCMGKAARDSLISRGWIFYDDFLNCDSTDMIFRVRTPSSRIFTIYADPNYPYNYDIDWENDGIFDSLGITTTISHQYSSSGLGKYHIRIRGTFPSIKFYPRANSSQELISFHQWGNFEYKNLDSAFMDCSTMEFIPTDIPNLDSVFSLQYTFENAKLLDTLGKISSWDVSNMTNMNSLFAEASNFNQPLSNWDVSNVTDMSYLFYGNNNFNQDISTWDVSSVTKMKGMFSKAFKFNQPLNNWDVSNVTDMSYVFQYTDSFNQPLNNWDVSNVTTMYLMFYSAENFNQTIGDWDVSSVTNLSGSFFLSTSFNQDISDWNISAVTNLAGIFRGATSFNQNLGDWDISSATDMRLMFDLSNLSTSNYDSTLISWQSKPHPNNISLGARSITYCLAETARDSLISNGWLFNGDSKDTACILTEIKEIEEVGARNFEIYPNPTNGITNLEISLPARGGNQKSNQHLFIYNQMGQLVKEQAIVNGKNQIDLTGMAEGIYFLKYGVHTEKLLLTN